MDLVNKKRAMQLGVRVGIVFLSAVALVITAAYFLLSKNFEKLLTDYSIKLVEAMTDQGVALIETELEMGKQEATFLANSFQAPDPEDETVSFPHPYEDDGYLRMVYVTEERAVFSEGSRDLGRADIRERRDIREAFAGTTGLYGPYFNESREFVICYSAPVKQDGRIVGVLSVEKDGYRFCDIIKDIRFVNSGESYIINEEGTDIAVSDQNHIEWVNSQYNARSLYADQVDEETKLIMDLEQKGLDGETGLGTYYWRDGLVYVFYKPVPSVGWVLLAGMREEEMAAMTRSTLFDSLSHGPVLGICLFLMVLLTVLIIYWIISSMKKSAEINEKLKIIASYDALTGLLNRNSYHADLGMMTRNSGRPFSCIYIDVNGLHEVNNHLGHQAGDEMLKAVADALRETFSTEGVYRIGGDEFVVFCWGKSKEEITRATDQMRESLRRQKYEISVGIACSQDQCDAVRIINEAEAEMQRDKQSFYEHSGKDRRARGLDQKMEQLIARKQDAETFLEVLEPEFKGVYFVNLSRDTVRHLYIPPYFEECLRETDDQFSRAILLYSERYVKPEYLQEFKKLCDYEKLKKQLSIGQTPELVYQKKDEGWIRLQILKFRDFTDEKQEVLWIFAKTGKPDTE